MDFERAKRRKLINAIEVLAVLAFFIFIGYQIWLYTQERAVKESERRKAVEEQLAHSETVSGDAAASQKAVTYTYEGEHPYSTVELPYGLASLVIETNNGSAAYANGKSAGVNLDVGEIMDGDTVTAVDLSNLGCEYLSLSGTGGDPVLTLRFSEGYTARVSLKHAIQAGFNKDGDVKVYNLQKDDDIDVTYIFNIDSYKYPGVDRFSFTGKAAADGAISLSLRGPLLSVSGLKFDSGMLSVYEQTSGAGKGVPADGSTGFFTYDFKTGITGTKPPKEPYFVE